MIRKLLALPAALTLLLVAAPAQPASARPWTADDQDPDANGCAYVSDLTRLNQTPLVGEVAGYAQQLASPTCGVVYTRVVLDHPDPAIAVSLEIDRWGSAGTFTTHQSSDGTAYWSNEIGAVPGVDCIESDVQITNADGELAATAHMTYSCPANW